MPTMVKTFVYIPRLRKVHKLENRTNKELTDRQRYFENDRSRNFGPTVDEQYDTRFN